ncbi:hypothetical protein ABTX71_32920 [Streptomyces parvulus]|uniref:hypothetical protein n=1 Tax=Streptomyces parvulus TaxID=146923 RepID=UPI003323B114
MRTARDLAALAGRLVAAQRLQLPLRAQLDLLDSIMHQSERCAAAAVYEAQQEGVGWEGVAADSGMTPAQASARWDAAALRALFPLRQAGDRRGAVQRLADALAFLQLNSNVSVDEAAERAGLPLAHVLKVLDGDALPSWPELYTLASVFGGAAEDLRALWESAAGVLLAPRMPAHGAAGYLAAALRGLYLSAGCPALARLSRQALLPTECLEQVLAGRHGLPWPATARLVRALGGRIDEVETLWHTARQAAVSLHGTQPAPQVDCTRCWAGASAGPG